MLWWRLKIRNIGRNISAYLCFRKKSLIILTWLRRLVSFAIRNFSSAFGLIFNGRFLVGVELVRGFDIILSFFFVLVFVFELAFELVFVFAFMFMLVLGSIVYTESSRETMLWSINSNIQVHNIVILFLFIVPSAVPVCVLLKIVSIGFNFCFILSSNRWRGDQEKEEEKSRES